MRELGRCVRALALATSFALGGCQVLGPHAIEAGRPRYNDAIHQTAIDQTLANVVRLYHHEPALFLDVSQVSTATSFSGSVTGGASNIGAREGTSGGTLAGRIGAASTALQYSETPTITYTPLTGQALVSQLATPVSVDALADLYDGNWGVAPLLDLATSYITASNSDFYTALDILIELDNDYSIELAAGTSALVPPKTDGNSATSRNGKVTLELANKPSGGANKDTLVVYFIPDRARLNDLKDRERVFELWLRLLRLYAGTQPVWDAQPPPKCPTSSNSTFSDPDKVGEFTKNFLAYLKTHLDQDTNSLLKCMPDLVELRTAPVPVPADKNASPAETSVTTHAPLMRTYSALGIVRNAVGRPSPRFEFVSPMRYDEIVGRPWNKNQNDASYYTLLSTDEDSFDCKDPDGCDNPKNLWKKYPDINNEVDSFIQNCGPKPEDCEGGPSAYESPSCLDDANKFDALSPACIFGNQRLGRLRRYILIIADLAPPPASSAYVSYWDGKYWYYIREDDRISKKNLQLLTAFLTIMSQTQPTPPPAPVINVGG